MRRLFLILSVSVFACSSERLPLVFHHETDGSVVPRESISGHPIPGNGFHDNDPSINDEQVHPTTCLLCCKSNSGKFNSTLCKNLQKVCTSKTCLKYLSKVRGSPLQNPNLIQGDRRSRTHEMLTPEHHSSEICKRLHPDYRNARMQPGMSESCSFFCISEHVPLLASHKTPNGWSCDDNHKVCWDGVCRHKAVKEDHDFCRSRANVMDGVAAADVQAVLKLPCYVVCKAVSTSVAWYVPRNDNPICNAPEWLPRDMGLDIKENH